jgi:RNA polymerase sigma-70 factor (ECF subfamily)
VRSELQQAVALLRRGDQESLDRAFALLQRTILSFGLKVCGNREDAEDTAQEVLLRALPHLVKLEDPQALSAWLYTAAKNRCWQDRRTAKYQRTVAIEQLLPDNAELQALLLADPAANPEEQILSRQDHRMLHEAVLTLPPQYRIVLVLHDMEELDTDAVARIMSIRTGTVRVRLHRARLLVRQEMARKLRHPARVSRKKQPAAKRPVAQRSAECREIFGNLSNYLDGHMEPETCDRMRRHIEACPTCVAFIQDLKRAIDRCRTLEVCPDAEAPPVLRRLLTEEYVRLKNIRANV